MLTHLIGTNWYGHYANLAEAAILLRFYRCHIPVMFRRHCLSNGTPLQSFWLMRELCNYSCQEPEPNMAEIQMENITWRLFICSQYHLI